MYFQAFILNILERRFQNTYAEGNLYQSIQEYMYRNHEKENFQGNIQLLPLSLGRSYTLYVLTICTDVRKIRVTFAGYVGLSECLMNFAFKAGYQSHSSRHIIVLIDSISIYDFIIL